MIELFSPLRTLTRNLSVALLLVFLTACFFSVQPVKGGGAQGKVKPHFAVLVQPVVTAFESVPGTLAKTVLTDWSFQHYSAAAVSSCITFLYKAFFISAYERNLFYFYTSINAP